MRANREKGMALITALLVMLLISSLIVGFSYLVMSGQSMGGFTSQRQKAFYGAEAGMEKLTADLNNLFAQNYAPSGPEVNALATIAQNPVIPGISYIDPAVGADGSGYAIAFPPDGAGNPLATIHTITSGPYQGLVGLLTPYQLTVIAQSAAGAEVKLRRTVNTVATSIDLRAILRTYLADRRGDRLLPSRSRWSGPASSSRLQRWRRARCVPASRAPCRSVRLSHRPAAAASPRAGPAWSWAWLSKRTASPSLGRCRPLERSSFACSWWIPSRCTSPVLYRRRMHSLPVPRS